MNKLLTGLLLAATVSFAAPLTYGTYSSWSAPGSLGATVNFDTLAGGTRADQDVFSESGIDFSASSGTLTIYTAASSIANLNGTQSLTGPNGSIIISLPTNIFGFGFYIGSAAGVAVELKVNGVVVSSPNLLSPSSPPVTSGTPVFWGYRSDTAVTSIELTSATAGYRVVIDNFSVASAIPTGGGGGGNEDPPPVTETPEVSSALLIGASLLLLPMMRKYGNLRMVV